MEEKVKNNAKLIKTSESLGIAKQMQLSVYFYLLTGIESFPREVRT